MESMNRFVWQSCVYITRALLIPLSCLAAWTLPASGHRGSAPVEIRNSTLRVGVAKIDITPETPVALEGYAEPENRISTGVHDRLYVRVIAFEDNTRRLVLISCDLGSFMFAEYFLNSLEKQFGLHADEILLCAIHTHSGPSLSLNKSYPHPNNFIWTGKVLTSLVTAVGQALTTIQPARMAFARGQSRVGVNRRKIMPGGTIEMGSNPDGPMDPEVPVLAITSAEGIPLAAMFAYSCHSRSLKGTSRLISGDVIGIAEQYVETAVGGRYVCAAFTGASGDVDPISVVSGFGELGLPPVPETVRLANMLGDVVVSTLRVCRLLDAGKILTGISTVRLPPKNPGKPKPIRVNAARIGEVGFVGLDCEAFVEVGLAIKAASPLKNIFVITNCNGWNGYLPVRHCYDEGGYEVRLSGFGPAAAEMLVEQAVMMLSSLRSP
jgi:neutral ceramidase